MGFLADLEFSSEVFSLGGAGEENPLNYYFLRSAFSFLSCCLDFS